MKAPLQRVNEKGVGGIWWCEPCIEAHEPELARNIKEDETKVEKDLKDILGFK
jgi:Zn-finger protein